MALLERDSLFKRLRSKPENKVRAHGAPPWPGCARPDAWRLWAACRSPQRSVGAQPPLAPASRRDDGLEAEIAGLLPGPIFDAIAVGDDACCRGPSAAAPREGLRARPRPLAACLPAGLLRLPCQEPHLGVCALWRLHLPVVRGHPPQPGRAPVVCEVRPGLVAALGHFLTAA